MNKRHVSYQQYQVLVERVILAVRASAYQPDLVLGVSRGGLFLADALSRVLRLPMAVIAASSYQEGAGTVQGELKISASIASVVPVCGNVLLVDDLVDSGNTLMRLCAHLTQMEPRITDLKTAVVWIKPTSVFQPDYAAEILREDFWIIQPFESRDF